MISQQGVCETLINIGCGEDLTIRELAETIKEVVGFEGKLVFDDSKPDGTPRKLLDVSKLSQLGWKPQFALKNGMQHAYQWYVENQSQVN